MRDGIDGRLWAEHHQSFSDSIGGFFAYIEDGFRRLQAIQYAAPWRRGGPPQA